MQKVICMSSDPKPGTEVLVLPIKKSTVRIV